MAIAPSGAPSAPKVAPGTYNAVCTDVQIKPEVIGQYGAYQNMLIVFQIEEKDEYGCPKRVFASFVWKVTTSNKTGKMLGNWRGTALSDTEAKSFDTAALLGKKATITLTLDGEWTNVTSISPPMKGNNLTPENDYKDWLLQTVKDGKAKFVASELLAKETGKFWVHEYLGTAAPLPPVAQSIAQTQLQNTAPFTTGDDPISQAFDAPVPQTGLAW